MPLSKFRTPDAAAYLGLSKSTLAKMRLRGDGPVYAKAGRRIVLYDRMDLDAWLDGRKRRSTSEQDLD
jgi:predicted DNA-binding transcriptional regulator AlpA